MRLKEKFTTLASWVQKTGQLLTALPVQLGITAVQTIRTVQFAQMEQQARKDLQNAPHAKEIHLLLRLHEFSFLF